MDFDQHEYEISFEWGIRGIENFAESCDVLVVIDVLSFSTSVDIAVSRGVRLYPFWGSERDAAEYALSVGASLAGRRGQPGPSLSPVSLQTVLPGTSLVLPSPNGSMLSLSGGKTPLFTGCLRNARAVAAHAASIGRRIGIIGAGERWRGDQSLRPALEDLIGAGAIIAHLVGSRSPEAAASTAVFQECRTCLFETLLHSVSGRELSSQGFGEDVRLAAELDASHAAPILSGQAFVDANATRAAGDR